MNISEDKTVAQVVTENIKASHIFKRHNIDFCCGGAITLRSACKEKGIEFEALAEELRHFDTVLDSSLDYDSWPLPVLIDHIVAVHHEYVLNNIPLILQYADRVAKVHGHQFSEVIEINELVKEVSQELTLHMKKEELILFPYIKQLNRAKNPINLASYAHLGGIDNPIKMLEDEHEHAGTIFKTINSLTNNYHPPKGACNTFKALYDKLNEFEQDLHKHIHLENNILHPKALVLERNLANSQN